MNKKRIKIIKILLLIIFVSSCKTNVIISPKRYPKNFPDTTINIIKYDYSFFSAKLISKGFSNGDVVLVKIKIYNDYEIDHIIFAGKKYYPQFYNDQYLLLIPLSVNLKSGMYDLKINFEDEINSYYVLSFKVKKRKFKITRYPLNLGRYSKLDLYTKKKIKKRIENERLRKKNAFNTNYYNKYFFEKNPFFPTKRYSISSEFWKTRLYLYIKNNKRFYRKKIHKGVDIRGDLGDPVYAIASGRVVLADSLFYEGNMVIINHGNNIFSYYMHMSKLNVEKGDKVVAGQKIGEIGSTGLSTGEHLHVSMIINGIQVDPLSFVVLPIVEDKKSE